MYRRNILGLKWLLSNNAKMTMQWQLPNNNEHLRFISEFQSRIFFFGKKKKFKSELQI